MRGAAAKVDLGAGGVGDKMDAGQKDSVKSSRTQLKGVLRRIGSKRRRCGALRVRAQLQAVTAVFHARVCLAVPFEFDCATEKLREGEEDELGEGGACDRGSGMRG